MSRGNDGSSRLCFSFKPVNHHLRFQSRATCWHHQDGTEWGALFQLFHGFLRIVASQTTSALPLYFGIGPTPPTFSFISGVLVTGSPPPSSGFLLNEQK